LTIQREEAIKKDVEFKTQDGETLAAWHYLPEQSSGKVPTIVMAHGFSAVKEMYLDRFAEVFAEAGLGALVFDNRNFGASGGEPRQEIDPWEQVRDYRDAITFAETLPETDVDRIGIWGSSYSGGHVLVVGAIEGAGQSPDEGLGHRGVNQSRQDNIGAHPELSILDSDLLSKGNHPGLSRLISYVWILFPGGDRRDRDDDACALCAH
jgi:fermentation-respiration switch protein FrsA (DUF1100 family)